MSGTGHVYEVSLEDGTPTKDHQNPSGDVHHNTEDGTLSLSIPTTKEGEVDLSVSLDAVSPAYAEAIESAVIDSTNREEGEGERAEQARIEDKNREERVGELERENAALKKEVAGINALLASEKEERTKADKRSAALDQEHSSQVDHLQRTLLAAQEQVQRVRDDALQREGERAKEDKLSDAQAQQRLHAQHGEQVLSLQDLVKELNAGLGAATQELEGVKRNLRDAVEQNTSNTQRIETLTREIHQHGGTLRTQEQRLQSEVDAKNEAVARLEAVKTQLRVKDAEYLVAQQNKAEAQARLGQTNVILSEIKKQNAELLRQLEEERARRASSDAAAAAAAKPAPLSSLSSPSPSSSVSSSTPAALDKKKPSLPSPVDKKRSSDWRPYSTWVPSVLFIGLSAVAAAKLLNK